LKRAGCFTIANRERFTAEFTGFLGKPNLPLVATLSPRAAIVVAKSRVVHCTVAVSFGAWRPTKLANPLRASFISTLLAMRPSAFPAARLALYETSHQFKLPTRPAPALQ